MKYDTVYYRTGGTERYNWHEALVDASDLDDVIDDLRRKGYACVKGKRSIGPPETFDEHGSVTP